MSVIDRIEEFMRSHPLDEGPYSTAHSSERCAMCGVNTSKSTYYRYMADDRGVKGYQSVCPECFYKPEAQHE